MQNILRVLKNAKNAYTVTVNKFYGEKNFRLAYKIIGIFLAVVWAVLFAAFTVRTVERKIIYPLKYEEEILEVSEKHGVDAAFVFAVANTESGFDPLSVSEKGAVGIMQIRAETAAYIAELRGITEYDIKNEKTNLDFGAYYLKYLSGKFHGIKEIAAAYNAGEGKVKEWLKNAEYSKDGKELYKIPYAETSAYVDKILRATDKYKKLYGKLLDKQKNFG